MINLGITSLARPRDHIRERLRSKLFSTACSIPDQFQHHGRRWDNRHGRQGVQAWDNRSCGWFWRGCIDTSGTSSPYEYTVTYFSYTYTDLAYTATIHTPTENYHAEGTSDLAATYDSTTGIVNGTEPFDSALTQSVLIAPTSKAQCKNDGWKKYPQFKNQAACVNYVHNLTS